ncbi:hypothetical protein [Alkalibacillus haloalkaliphilus]|uniref:hypothetical protein n=1 Tax=Alkalibacillus haloalkaliphilus TaxID=94136 RepID=UPI002936010E|nr:hypothetical protein [Alkalibacillus haloalkaliphilus]MDV2582403.1 hypothetical protein [Alkalibacillus haloalkaliphilus]
MKLQDDRNPFEVTDKIENAYEAFSETHSPDVLDNLSYEEFVTLYFYTDRIEDDDTLYELHIQEEKYLLYESKEQFIRERSDRTSEERLSSSLEEDLLAMYKVNLKEDTEEVGVRLWLRDEKRPLTFRIGFENGVKKAHWLPLQ